MMILLKILLILGISHFLIGRLVNTQKFHMKCLELKRSKTEVSGKHKFCGFYDIQVISLSYSGLWDCHRTMEGTDVDLA